MSKKEVKKSDLKKGASPSSDYGAKNIFVLEGLDPVRKRPGMYIGSTGIDGLHHLISEVVDNAIDEAMAGFAKNIEVRLLGEHRVSVADDGRGIPVDIHPQTKKSSLETVMTVLHAGGKFDSGAYKVSGGLHGVGVSVVNALSKFLRAEVCRDGGKYIQEYERGKPKGKVKKIGPSKLLGTTVIFDPDEQIFGGQSKKMPEYDFERLAGHLQEQAYLTKGTRVRLVDGRAGKEQMADFYFEGGIVSFIRQLSQREQRIGESIFYASKKHEETDVEVEVTFVYTNDISGLELSFANNIRNIEGGMHLTGFRTALTRVLNDFAKREKYIKEDESFTGEDVREGMQAIISVKLKEPQFEGQTKAKLGNTEARSAVDAVVSDSLKDFLEKNPGDAKKIIEKCLLAAKARKAAKAAKETVLRKGILEGLSLPGKLTDCLSRNPEESEIFIVEGNSAGGSAKQGRDRRFQAILPLRGKVLNAEKARLAKIIENKEVKSLIIALGTAVAEEFDISKLRYHKVIIMTDADVDGEHIRALLLTLFFRFLPEVVTQGHLYVAQPPLYQIKKGKQSFYAYTDEDKEKILREINKDKQGGVQIQRYKGLGEMNPEQLWETTMDPEKRVLKQVQVEDVKKADEMFDVLMGVSPGPRKQFIQAYAKAAKNLDI